MSQKRLLQLNYKLQIGYISKLGTFPWQHALHFRHLAQEFLHSAFRNNVHAPCQCNWTQRAIQWSVCQNQTESEKSGKSGKAWPLVSSFIITALGEFLVRCVRRKTAGSPCTTNPLTTPKCAPVARYCIYEYNGAWRPHWIRKELRGTEQNWVRSGPKGVGGVETPPNGHCSCRSLRGSDGQEPYVEQ